MTRSAFNLRLPDKTRNEIEEYAESVGVSSINSAINLLIREGLRVVQRRHLDMTMGRVTDQ